MTVDITPGEIRITAVAGRNALQSLGLSDEQLKIEGGNIRLVFELGNMEGQHFFKNPTIEIAYHEHLGESTWVAEFNGENILEKTDHAGNATLLLLQRGKLEALLHRHENILIIHGDLPAQIGLNAANTFFNLIEPKH